MENTVHDITTPSASTLGIEAGALVGACLLWKPESAETIRIKAGLTDLDQKAFMSDLLDAAAVFLQDDFNGNTFGGHWPPAPYVCAIDEFSLIDDERADALLLIREIERLGLAKGFRIKKGKAHPHPWLRIRRPHRDRSGEPNPGDQGNLPE